MAEENKDLQHNGQNADAQHTQTQEHDEHKKAGKGRWLIVRIISMLNRMTLTVASLIAVLLMFVSAASVYVTPVEVPYASLLGLIFPATVLLTVLVGLLTLVLCFRRSWICILGLILVSGSIRSYFPLNPFQAAHMPTSHALRVMNYNTHNAGLKQDSTERYDYLQYVLDQQADIYCFQEGAAKMLEWDSINPRFRQRYPYCEYREKGTNIGCCSRFPIKRTEVITHVEGGNSAIAYWIDLPEKHDILVINCHLQSNRFTPEDRGQYSNIVHNNNQPEKPSEEISNTSRTLAGKYVDAAVTRALMADTVANYITQHRDVPIIVCGDFNDTPISYSCYRIKRLGFNDAYRMAGNGMGRSFNKDAIAVRIDHQFCTDHLKPISARIDKLADWSDHYPFIATYEWVK